MFAAMQRKLPENEINRKDLRTVKWTEKKPINSLKKHNYYLSIVSPLLGSSHTNPLSFFPTCKSLSHFRAFTLVFYLSEMLLCFFWLDLLTL